MENDEMQSPSTEMLRGFFSLDNFVKRAITGLVCLQMLAYPK